MEKSAHYLLGKRGEERACLYLETAGYTLREKNYANPFGEIDIIAQSGKTVCFIEVKTRSSNRFGSPADALTSSKRRKLLRTATCYIEGNQQKGRDFRFDVVEMFYEAGCDDFIEINHITDAFENE